MLPNYAPLAVVEQFGMLEELHPGRIDLGSGRSSGGDQIASHALRRPDQDYAPLLAELLAFFRGEFPEGIADACLPRNSAQVGNTPADSPIAGAARAEKPMS
jgi:alkanesulfonate monooxygenase SsuD/methylene tetrahydromethanopterin reductase-like flavin-dependent oxidoreductase (luciferase family)